ncbi:MAG: cytochrome c [Rhodospirillales bacterium]|nr:cytochrome c [Rhodospirillales bacterium]
MSSRRQTIVFALIATAVLPLTIAQGDPSPAYRPGLGDLMTMTVQPRHLKVGLALEHRNWAYAAFEVHELEEALEHVARLVPKWRDLDVAGLIKGSTTAPLEAMEEAVKAKDVARFNEAYGQLTAACNACHQSAKLEMIVIQVPKGGGPFANQDFRPGRP